MEAITSMKDKATDVKCVLGNETFVYKYNMLELLEHDFDCNNKFAISVNEILNGKWYILD